MEFINFDYFIDYIKSNLNMTDEEYKQAINNNEWFKNKIEILKNEYYKNGSTAMFYNILLQIVSTESGCNKYYIML